MKSFYPLTLTITFLLAGCGSHGDDAPVKPGPDSGLSAQQKIDKIQSNANIPDGLKRIQTDTLQHQHEAPLK